MVQLIKCLCYASMWIGVQIPSTQVKSQTWKGICNPGLGSRERGHARGLQASSLSKLASSEFTERSYLKTGGR